MSRRCWRWVGASLAVLAVLVVAPASSALAQEADDPPPVVTNVTASPSSLPAEGGLVTILADASDEGGGVTWVSAQITGPYGGPETVLMSFTGVGSTYAGSLTIAANVTDQPVSYAIAVQAIDLGGSTSWGYGGPITVDAAAPFDERPVVYEPLLSPSALPTGGGAVTIAASAYDDRAISELYATVTRPDGSTTDVPLEPVSATGYSGVFAAPANTSSTAARYTVVVTALDDIGQSASVDAGAVTVAAAPPPPSAADLRVSPGAITFRTIRVGDRVRGSLVVRNAGRRTTSPVSGVVGISGAGFTLVGGGPTGLAFTLRAGEAKTVLVEFRPTGPGRFTGAVTVRRGDGRQPGLAVRLSGQAIRRRGG